MRVFKCPKVHDDCSSCQGVVEAISVLRTGGLVVYPTDTVYGLGGLALEPGPVDKVFMAKGRPDKVPMPVAVPDINDILLVADLNKAHLDPLKKLAGEPITWVLPAGKRLPERLLGGGTTIGVRVIDRGCPYEMMLGIGPITATSANVHGEDPSCTVLEASSSLGELVKLYIDIGRTELCRPTTVVEPRFGKGGTTIESVRIIREGAIKGTLIRERLVKE